MGGFEGGDDDGGVGRDGQVAGGDADAPAAGAPFGVFVVGQGAGRHGEDRAAGEVALLDEAFENMGFPGAGGRVHDRVPSRLQGAHGLSLPGVRQHK